LTARRIRKRRSPSIARAIRLFEATVYDGVREALAALKGASVRLILCTAKPQVYAARILQHFDLDRHFEAMYGAELDGRFEDKGDLIDHILGDRGISAGDCVMWATANMTSSQRPGMRFRPSARCGVTEARKNFAKRARQRSARRPGRFPQPSRASPE
jgi:hypothetical protein